MLYNAVSRREDVSMARCNSCSKFVSYGDEPEIDVESALEVVDVDATPTSGDPITFAVTVYLEGSVEAGLACAECADRLAQASIETNGEVEHTCTAEAVEPPGRDDFGLDADDPSGYLDT